MRLLVQITTIFLSAFLLSSCTKESINSYPIEGLWIGTYSVDGLPSQGEYFYSLAVYPDGKLLTKSYAPDGKDHFSSGTWSLSSDNTFKATIVTFSPNSGSTAITQEMTATYSTSGRLTNGTWSDTVSPYTKNKGKFSTFERVN
jgi:hypothetical protein